jgi:cytidylate kinase
MKAVKNSVWENSKIELADRTCRAHSPRRIIERVVVAKSNEVQNMMERKMKTDEYYTEVFKGELDHPTLAGTMFLNGNKWVQKEPTNIVHDMNKADKL